MKPLTLLSCLGLAAAAAFAPSARAAIVAGDVLYVDFGKNNTTDGIAMASPDTNGHYWNDAIHNFNQAGGSGSGANAVVAPVNNLVTQSNVATGVNLSFSNGWQANGFLNGGLQSPSPALLGDFAFKNVTGDYFFFDTSAGSPATVTLTLSNLDQSLTYSFQMFATRDTTEVRTTSYSITDINGIHSVNLQTSGPGIGDGGANGNNNTFAYLNNIVPTAGSITLTLDNVASGFAYIGAMKVTAAPEPSSMGMVGLGGVLLVLRRRRK